MQFESTLSPQQGYSQGPIASRGVCRQLSEDRFVQRSRGRSRRRPLPESRRLRRGGAHPHQNAATSQHVNLLDDGTKDAVRVFAVLSVAVHSRGLVFIPTVNG